MMIASYRNTERGIRAARQQSVVLPFIAPVKPQLIVPDKSLVLITASKLAAFMDAVNAEYTARQRVDKASPYHGHYERIVRRFCRLFKVNLNDVYSDRRDLGVVNARQAIYYWAWRLTPLSAPQIGQRMGGRDHTTILRGVSTYQQKRSLMGRHLRELRKGRN